MRWHALVLFTALLPHRWFGQMLATRTAVPTELVGAALWASLVTAVFLLLSPASRLVRFGPLGRTEVSLGLGAGVLLLVLGAAGYVASEAVLGLTRPEAVGGFASLRGSGEILAAGVAVLAVVLCEEIAFRGVVLEAFRGELGPALAVVLSAAAFSAYHLSAYQLLSTFLYGGVLAGLTLWTGGLWTAVVAHLTLNGLGIVLSLFLPGGTGA